MPPLALPPAPAPLASADPTTLAAPTAQLDQHPAAIYLAQLSARSRRTMATSLDTIAALLGYPDALQCPWAALRYQHTAAIRAALLDAYAPATANKMLAALKRTLQEAWRLGQISADDYRRAVDLKTIRDRRLPAGRALTMDEITALLSVCAEDASGAGVRDAALIALLAGAGLRRSEIVALDLEHYTPASGALKVRGKGGKERIVYAEGGARTALADWLVLRGDTPGALFVAATRGGHLTTRRMTDQAVLVILTKRGRLAGLAHFSPHDLRRTMITGLLDAGADLVVAQRLAGHAKIETTARYDRRGEQAKQQAASLLQIPHVPRRTLPLDDDGTAR